MAKRMGLTPLQIAAARMRLAWLSDIRGVNYQLWPVKCTHCSQIYVPYEVIGSYETGKFDGYSTCPMCAKQNYVILNGRLVVGNEYFDLATPQELLTWLIRFRHGTPKDLWQTIPGVCHQVVVVYGTLAEAFKVASIKYDFSERLSWADKVSGYLSALPDKVIAGCAGVPVAKIRNLRKRQGLPPYKASECLRRAKFLMTTAMTVSLPEGVEVKKTLPRLR